VTRSKLILTQLLLFIFLSTIACDSPGIAIARAAPQDAHISPTDILPYASSTLTMQRDYTESMQAGGLTRTYYIHLPLSYTGQQAVPLVLAFHGSGATGKDLADQTHLNEISDEEGFILVYPDGYQEQWADGRGTTPPEQAGVDDVGFVSALIDKLLGELNIDKSRVYVTGFSNGGIFVQRLACELADKITAMASVSGTMAANISAQCQPARPIPVLLFMGTNDPSVPFDGGEVDGNQGIDLSAAETIQQWTMHNACSPTPSTTQAPSALNDGTDVFRTEYSSCKNNADVILYTIEDGVHTWPDGTEDAQTAESHNDLDTSQVIWNFFSQYSN
jgi:polyhydroxybutyrate depolymerase